MQMQTRMSPFTAGALGFTAIVVSCIGTAAAVALYGLNIVNNKVDQVLGLADHTVGGIPAIIESVTAGVPELLDSLPAVFSDALHDRRAPDYVHNLDIKAELRVTGRDGRWSPVLTITNNGDQMVSLMCVRVAVLDESGAPRREWTEVVATPLAFDHDWRGPLMPRATRYIVLHDWPGLDAEHARTWQPVVEVSELRLWTPQADTQLARASQPSD
ncbi:MAG: hypothetical protein IID40_07510 [Planctomycetes bacterium]|nr:hypothetical protein [Planctomycetota bacterium]